MLNKLETGKRSTWKAIWTMVCDTTTRVRIRCTPAYWCPVWSAPDVSDWPTGFSPVLMGQNPGSGWKDRRFHAVRAFEWIKWGFGVLCHLRSMSNVLYNWPAPLISFRFLQRSGRWRSDSVRNSSLVFWRSRMQWCLWRQAPPVVGGRQQQAQAVIVHLNPSDTAPAESFSRNPPIKASSPLRGDRSPTRGEARESEREDLNLKPLPSWTLIFPRLTIHSGIFGGSPTPRPPACPGLPLLSHSSCSSSALSRGRIWDVLSALRYLGAGKTPLTSSSAVSAIPEAQALPSSFPNFHALEPL